MVGCRLLIIQVSERSPFGPTHLRVKQNKDTYPRYLTLGQGKSLVSNGVRHPVISANESGLRLPSSYNTVKTYLL